MSLDRAVAEGSAPTASRPSTFSLEASPASRSASQGSSAGWRTIVGYGPSSHEPFASYDQDWSLSRMSPDFSPPPGSSPEDAYAAGLVDGEGSLTITRSGRWYSPRIEVGMTERAVPVLRSMQEQFGGQVTKMRDATDRWEAAWRWVIVGKPAMECLRRIAPFLRLKHPHAVVLFELSRIKSSSDRAAELKRQVNELNKKGPARRAAGRWIKPQQTLTGEWEQYSETWPSSGMTRNGRAFPRRPLVPRTSVTESGLLHTPTETANQGSPSMRSRDRGSWFKTPTAAPSSHGGGGGELHKQVTRWPMPTARDHKDGQYNPNVPINGLLGRAVWRTPTARDHKGASGVAYKLERGSAVGLNDQVKSENGGALNPAWVEWLMGFPPGWTDIGPQSRKASRASRTASSPESTD
jgi:hypothetical protein